MNIPSLLRGRNMSKLNKPGYLQKALLGGALVSGLAGGCKNHDPMTFDAGDLPEADAPVTAEESLIYAAAKASPEAGVMMLGLQFQSPAFNGRPLDGWLNNAPVEKGKWEDLKAAPLIAEAQDAIAAGDMDGAIAALAQLYDNMAALSEELKGYPPVPGKGAPDYSPAVHLVEGLQRSTNLALLALENAVTQQIPGLGR